MTGTPALQMLWEASDPNEVLATRFGHHDAGAVARWVANTLEARWGLVVDSCERIVMSDHNTLAWITTPAGPLVLKWSIATRQFPRLEALAELTGWLAKVGLPVSKPVVALDGQHQVEFDGVSLSLQRQINGGLLDIAQPGQVREAGVVLGRLHDALLEYPGRIPDVAVPTMPLSRQIKDWLDSDLRHLPAAAPDGLRRLLPEAGPDNLPTQLVHGDYRSANILVDATGIVAVIDFEEARTDHRVVELARSAVLLGTRFHNWGPVPADVHAGLLEGYESHRRLTPAEASWWRPLLLWYSLMMAPLAGDPAGWTESALDQLGGGGISRITRSGSRRSFRQSSSAR